MSVDSKSLHMERNMSGADKLDTFLLLKVFEFLSPEDLCIFRGSLVCRRWRYALYHTSHGWYTHAYAKYGAPLASVRLTTGISDRDTASTSYTVAKDNYFMQYQIDRNWREGRASKDRILFAQPITSFWLPSFGRLYTECEPVVVSGIPQSTIFLHTTEQNCTILDAMPHFTLDLSGMVTQMAGAIKDAYTLHPTVRRFG